MSEVETPAGETVEQHRTFEVHENRLAEAKKLVAKASKKAERYGLAGYGLTVSELKERPVYAFHPLHGPDKTRVLGYEGYYTVEVTGVMPRFEGWSFVATIDHEEEVPISRPVPGVEVDLGDFRARAAECDYCGKRRQRSNVYVFQHEDGRLQQVGSSCLVPFFGVKVSAMMQWLSDGSMAGMDELKESAGSEGYGGGPSRVSVAELMRVACAAEQISGFRSKASVQYSNDRATINDALVYLFPSQAKADAEWVRYLGGKADWAAAEEKAAAVLAWAQQQDGSSEYAANLRALAGAESVKAFGNSGLLVSAIGGYNREQGLIAEREVAAAAEWVGVEKGKVTVVGKVAMTRRMAGWGYHSSDRELVVVAGTVDGKPARIKWWASSVTGLDEGDAVTLTGTVKAHEEYQGKKETVVTRAKFEAVSS